MDIGVLIYVVKIFLSAILSVLNVAMLLRAIFSWIDPEGGMRFSVFLYMVTEPIIQPIRKLCYKMNWFQRTPLDIPFLIVVLLLLLLETLVEIL